MVVADSQPGHIDQIKQTNAGAVYRLIDQLGPVSRIDLSRWRNWRLPALPKSSAKCWKRIWFRRRKSGAGSRGRPAVGLVVETEAWHYLSMRISRGEIFLALRDLSSKLVVEESWNWRWQRRTASDAAYRISISSLFAISKSWSA
jgi:transcriptional regulator of PTS gene